MSEASGALAPWLQGWSPLNSGTLHLNISSKYHISVCSEKNAKKFQKLLIKKKNTAEAVGTECI